MKVKKNKMLVWVVLFLALFMVQAFRGVDGFEQRSESESVQMIEESIRRAAVQCYAIEGSYPPDIAYLTAHYGLVINEEAYFYHYEVIGANIMPIIAVFRRW